jgi:hypothetical protein
MKKCSPIFAVFISILFVVPVCFATSGWIDFASGKFTTPQAGGVYAYPEVNLLAANAQEVILEVSLPGMATDDMIKNGTTYQRLSIPGGGKTYNLGWAELPQLGRFIAVPQGAKPQVEVLDYTSQTLSGFNVFPVQEQPFDFVGAPEPGFTKDLVFYQRNEFYPDRMAFAEEPKIIRGCAVSFLALFPVQYNPATKELKVCSYIKVRVSFTGGTEFFVEPSFRSPYFEPLYQNMLLNYASLGSVSPLRGKSDTGCDLLIITHPTFQAWAESLALWKNLCGIPTWVKTTTQTGSDTGSIRNYIQNAYNTWSPPPSFVLLVGDAEFIPVFYRTTHPYDGYKTGTDLYYSTVAGSDWFPDIFMGRISVDLESQAGVVVRKILQYERNPISTPASFYSNVLVAGYFQDESPIDGWEDRFFIKTNEVVRDFLLTQGYAVERCYNKTSGSTPCCYYYGDPLPPGLVWTGNATQISNAINNGVFIVNHRDHGAFEGWGNPSYTVTNVNALTNQDRLPVVFSINCETGYFDNETDASGAGTSPTAVCFSEAFQRKANGGAVGVFGHSRVSYSGLNDELCKGMYDALWPNFDPSYPGGGSTHPVNNTMFRMGPAMNFGKFWMYDKYYLTGGAGYPWGSDLTGTLVTFEMLHYFGDPTMEIWTSLPDTLEVDHPDVVILGGMEFPVTVSLNGQPVKNALVCLVKDVEVYEVGRTDSIGQVTLNPVPLTIGTMNLTVTAHNAHPYKTTLTVISPGVYLTYVSSQIDDDSLGASRGNGDGLVGFEETIEMPIWLRNLGDSTADNTYGILTTTNPYVNVTIDSAYWGQIPHADTVQCQNPFVFTVSAQIPDQTVISFHLDVNATNGNWDFDKTTLVAHAPALVYDSKQTDDIGGNDNGKPDPGETCTMNITLRNDGSAPEAQISSQLSCSDPYVTITASNASYPDIPAGGKGTSFTPYHFEISSSCPMGHEAFMILQISGWGSYTTTDTFIVLIGQTPILLVDDDGGGLYESYFLTALDSTGFLYDVWTYATQGTPPDSVLELYQVLVWTTGPDYGTISNPKTLTPTDQARLTTYLDNGGKLFLSSQDFLLDNNPNTFINNYLHVAGHADDKGVDSVAGVSEDTITNGMAFALTNPFSNFSDWIVPGAGAGGIFYDRGTGKGSAVPRDGAQWDDYAGADIGNPVNYCALRYPASGQSTYKVVFSAFAFEMVPQNGVSPNNSYTLMRRILSWFGLGRSTPAFKYGDVNGDELIDLGDMVYLISYLYRSGPAPDPLLAGDVNCNGLVDLGDLVHLISFLYKAGAPPCPSR